MLFAIHQVTWILLVLVLPLEKVCSFLENPNKNPQQRRPSSITSITSSSSSSPHDCGCGGRTVLAATIVNNVKAPTSNDWSCYTVVRLKEELGRHGLKVSGRKAELLQRLEEYHHHHHHHHYHHAEEQREDDNEGPSFSPEPVVAVESHPTDATQKSNQAIQQVDSSWTVAQLKGELKVNGLKVSGRKDELIHRLQKHHVKEREDDDEEDDTMEVSKTVLEERSEDGADWNEREEEEMLFGSFSSLSLSEQLSTAVMETTDTRVAETKHAVEDDDSSMLIPKPFQMGKSKWRNKRFLMMQDVVKMIYKGDRKAVRKAQDTVERTAFLLKQLDDPEEEEEGPEDESIMQRAYNIWIHAIAKSKYIREKGRDAEAVLRRMEEEGIAPNIVSYTSVMDAYAEDAVVDKYAPEQAERILFRLIENMEQNPKVWNVTSITFDTVLKAWARQESVEGAERAQQILDQWEQLLSLPETTRPTAHSYATVVSAWANCGGKVAAAERAEDILERLLLSQSTIQPDVFLFNSVIHAWRHAGSRNAGAQANRIMEQMKELASKAEHPSSLLPDVVTYNSVLAAWSHCGSPNAAIEAERVLQQMRNEHQANPEQAPAPISLSYNSVLHAWSSAKLPDATKRAEAILRYMIQSQKPAPDHYSFTSVLNSLAKSKDRDKVERASQLLHSMMEYRNKNKSLRLNQIPFNTVLNACAYPAPRTTLDEKKQALQIAVNTLQQMRALGHRYTQPDTVTYGNMLKCIANLIPVGNPARNPMALQLFQNCASEGLVGELVWTEIQRAVEPTSFLMDSLRLPKRRDRKSIGLYDLPFAWKENVSGDRLAKSRRQNRQRKVVSPKRDTKQSAPIRPSVRIVESSASDRDM